MKFGSGFRIPVCHYNLWLFRYAFTDYCILVRHGHDTDTISSCFTCHIVI